MAGNERQKACRTFIKRLSRYADGDLGPGETAEAKRHLASCARCAAEFEVHKKMVLLLESSKEVEAPWDLDLKVLEAVGFGGARTQLRGYGVSPPLVWAASVVAMILVGLGGIALKDGISRAFSIVFGPAGVLSTEEMAGFASQITRYFVTVWEGLAAALGTFQPLLRSLGAVSHEVWGNPAAMGTIAGTVALVALFFRIITKGRRSRVSAKGRRPHAGNFR